MEDNGVLRAEAPKYGLGAHVRFMCMFILYSPT